MAAPDPGSDIPNGAWTGPVIASYQGAFGPPTKGHMQGADMAAAKILEDFPHASSITILWMLTPGGSDKKEHLSDTRAQRYAALGVYSSMLNEKYTGRVRFEPSYIEVDIDGGLAKTPAKSVATIHTLRKLRELHPAARIVLIMGFDNLYNLPYWVDSEKYFLPPLFVKDIYITYRQPDDKELPTLREAKSSAGVPIPLGNGANILFTSVAPGWAAGKSIELFSSVIDNFRFHLVGQPIGTSSSILRCIMQKIASGDHSYKHGFEVLVGLNYDDPRAEPWKAMLGATSNFRWDTEARCAPKLVEYSALLFTMDALAKGGRRRKSKKRTHRKSKKSKKNKRSSK